MVTIETLEVSLLEIQKKVLQVDKLLESRSTMTPEDHVTTNKEISVAIRVHLPNLGLEKDVRMLIEQATTHTEEFGHSPRADRVKNRAFEILGMCVGDEL